MRSEVVLITGANGEIGHGLITQLAQQGNAQIVALDVRPLNESLRPYCYRFVQADILDDATLKRLAADHKIRVIYHLASILSTKAEHNPEIAHHINVEGTLKLLHLAEEQSQQRNDPVKFLYPSSIAVYGLPDLETKGRAGRIQELQWLQPTTIYGCNKLYCEYLGDYYAKHYRQLAKDCDQSHLEFRCLRFPGLISAVTIPTGGTSDYAPEMIHQAAQGLPYACFVRPDTRLPFMAMPDAIRSLLMLEAAPRQNLTQLVYNVTSFNPTAQEIHQRVQQAFPQAQTTFVTDVCRQSIVDSWPGDLDDSAARRDWGWLPEYDLERAFGEYLIPNIRQLYAKG